MSIFLSIWTAFIAPQVNRSNNYEPINAFIYAGGMCTAYAGSIYLYYSSIYKGYCLRTPIIPLSFLNSVDSLLSMPLIPCYTAVFFCCSKLSQ